jgi:hypothetical protein
VTRGSFLKLTERDLTPLKVRARGQIVVERRPELPFEIVWGSQGGAAVSSAEMLRMPAFAPELNGLQARQDQRRRLVGSP